MTSLHKGLVKAGGGRAQDPDLQVPTGLALGLFAVTAAAAALTFLVPSVLTGVPAMNGSARGTALVLLVVAVPMLGLAIPAARRGSTLGQVLWVGATAYVAYNAVLFCFATPFNELFLLYVAMLSLSFWSLIMLLGSLAPPRGGSPNRARWVAIYIWVVVGLNTMAWLARIVPALFDEQPTSLLEDSGMPTNTVFVQDLAIWLPAMAFAALLLWRAHPWGLFAAAAGMVFWQLEALGVAVDQWFGHRADPGTAVASQAGMWLFVVLFIVGVWPATVLLRKVTS